MIRILNYLPASPGSMPLPSRLGITSGLLPFEEHSTPWNMPMTGDHWVGCGCLGYVAVVVMCAEGGKELWQSHRSVNVKNINHEKFLIAGNSPVQTLEIFCQALTEYGYSKLHARFAPA